ncbi:MAG TPA: hypothetical protein DEA90_02700 [Opitutae bacterium]|nr:hypothetical protein [Opitutae bacterium]
MIFVKQALFAIENGSYGRKRVRDLSHFAYLEARELNRYFTVLMNSHYSFKALSSALALVVVAHTADAIKITVPDQYQGQIDAIKAAELKQREQDLQVSGRPEVNESAASSEQSAAEPSVAADEFLVQSVVEATDAATEFEGTLAADEGLVSGQVVDKESGQPVSGVAIIIEGTDIATVTDETGRYSLGPATAGLYTLSFIKSGYIEANVTEYTVAGGEVSVFPFALPPRPAEMSDDVYELQDFTVTAEEANNLMMQLDLVMNSESVLSVMSAEDFSKFAASDIGDAIKRVSGVSVVGGKYAVIRGLGDRYVSTTLNGLPIASPDPDRQAVQLDLFPSGLFDGLEVTKSFTPDQPATSTGGINMKIKELPDGFFANFSTSLGYHSNATGNDDFLTSGRVTSQDQWANGAEDRALPDVARSFPEDLNKAVWPLPTPPPGGFITQAEKDAAIAEANAITDALGRDNHAKTTTPGMDYGFKLSGGHGYEWADRYRFGVIGGVNYSRKARMIEDGTYFRSAADLSGTDTLSPEVFLDPDRAVGYQEGTWQESTYSSTLSWLLGVDFELDEAHKIRVHRLDLRVSEDEVEALMGQRYTNDPFSNDGDFLDTERQETLRYTERRLVSDQVLGDHTFEFDGKVLDEVQFEWGLGRDRASQDEPGFIQTRAILLDSGDWTLQPSANSAGVSRAQFASWREIIEEKESDKYDITFKRDLEGEFQTQLKLGYLNTEAQRSVFDEYVSFLGVDLSDTSNTTVPGVTDPSDPMFMFFDELAASGYEVAADVDLNSESTGQYFMLDQTLFEKFRIVGGYRFERNSSDVRVNGDTKLKGAGASNPLAGRPSSGGYEVEDWYPGLSLIYSLNDQINLRFAYSQTIALPSAREVSPYATASFSGSDVDVGNPSLQPSEVESLDIGFSYMNDAGDSFSVTVFQKTVQDRIEKVNGIGADTFKSTVSNPDPFDYNDYNVMTRSESVNADLYSWYNNPNEATLRGVELEGRKSMGFIWSGLDYLSVGGNFTYIDGTVERFPIEIASKNAVGRPVSDERALTEQPESLLNFDLTYDNPESGVRVSLIYYMVSDTLKATSLVTNYDIYEASYDAVDLTISKRFADRYKISFSAKNITDSVRQKYYDVEGYEKEYESYRAGISYSISGTVEF